MRIPLLGVGKVPEDALRKTKNMLNSHFKKLRFYVKGKVRFPDESYNDFRDQYMAERVMDSFREDGIQVLITKEDVYSKGNNYVFGEAEYRGPAIVSMHRLDPRFYDEEGDNDIFLRRLKKEVIHELGHCFGMDHCENPGCVMQYSGSVKGIDDKGENFCEECQLNISTKGLPLG
ncbi:MAG: archaemetzincin family Zn-dependent metalloprotease [Candidatus Aenigmatarchaeota archaeon]